jgi:hypothetical protein
MMTWNLRLVEIVAAGCQDEQHIEIREVHYDQLGKPFGHGRATASGSTIEEIRQYLTWSLEALEKPVLIFGDDDEDRSEDNQGE